MAKWPELVPKRLCKVPITVRLYEEGWDEDGAPIEATSADLLCNYQDKGETIVTNDQEYVRISGSAYFNGDPFPEMPNLTGGTVTIFNNERKIVQGEKGRNPDGTVNVTRLRLL